MPLGEAPGGPEGCLAGAAAMTGAVKFPESAAAA